MRKTIHTLFVITVLLLSASTLIFAASQVIERFTATKKSDAVNIEGTTLSEDNVASFEVQRMTNGSFKTINTKSANGSPSSYKYSDTDNFTKETSQNTIQAETIAKYRIKIVYSNSQQSSYTEEISVNRDHTAIKRTLGMLKEMFK